MGIFTVVFSYIASIIGAGFASGQEIVSFFLRYGRMSIFGAALAAAVFGLFEYCVLDECRKGNITTCAEYSERIMPGILGRFHRVLTLVFSGITFCTMAAGGGALAEELIGVDAVWGNIAVCVPALALVLLKNQAALKYNALLGGIIVVGVISCCLYILCFREHQAFSDMSRIAASSVSYAGYNLITAALILVKLSRYIKSRADAVAAAVMTSVIMFFVMALMWALLAVYYGKINLGEIPMLTMAKRQNAALTAIYAALLFLSVLTTAVASGIGVAELVDRRYSLPVLAAAALTFGSAGFANLVNYAYRICGYFGIVFTIYVIVKKFKNSEKKRISKNNKANI